MKCNRCDEILSDEYTYFEPDMETNDVFTIDAGSYYLCNECATELLQDAQSAREEDE